MRKINPNNPMSTSPIKTLETEKKAPPNNKKDGAIKPMEVKNSLPRKTVETTAPIRNRNIETVKPDSTNIYLDIKSESEAESDAELDSGYSSDPKSASTVSSGFFETTASDNTSTISANNKLSIHETTLEWAMTKTQSIMGPSFDSRLFLSGKGDQQGQDIQSLANVLAEELSSVSTALTPQESLRQLLTDVKASNPSAHDHSLHFALRSAILLASEQTGANIASWEVYTHQQPTNVNQWDWLESPSSWIPEAQGAAAKYTETALIKALNLAKAHPEQLVVAYKGGFGAGKTSHGKEAFGEDDSGSSLFKGSIAPDSAKQVVRKTMPVSHNAAHIHGSNLAYNLFNDLIKHSIKGTIVYDSSLARSNDVDNLIKKSQAAQKSCKIIDITRDDRARCLAVLARSITGEDPRPPVATLLRGAQIDRSERAACFNSVLNSQETIIINKKDKKEKKLSHSYEFHCGDSMGGDRQLLFKLRSGKPPEWNITEHQSMADIEKRLSTQGIRFDSATQQFVLIDNQDWSKLMEKELSKPVCELVEGLSEGEKKIRTKQFLKRTIHFDRPMPDASVESLYESLPLSFSNAIPLESMQEAFSTLDDETKSKTLESLKKCSQQSKQKLSYMDLPASLALELHRFFITPPPGWEGAE